MKRSSLLLGLLALGMVVAVAVHAHGVDVHSLTTFAAAAAAAAPAVDWQAELAKITTEFEQRDTSLKALIEKANGQVADTGRMTAELKAELTKTVESGTALQARLVDVEQKLGRRNPMASTAVDFDKLFAENEGFKLFRDGKARNVRVGLKRNDLMHAAITSGAGSGADLVVPQRVPGIMSPQQRLPLVRDLIMQGRTVSNAIEFVQESGFTNNANVVAENTTKPESQLTFEMISRPVRTIAHWVKASKIILDDVPQLLSYVQGRLRYGLQFKEDYQLLRGDNTGQNLDGLIPNATEYETGRTKAGDTKIDVIRHAITQLRIAEYAATGIIVNPTDWDEMETEKDDNGRYIWANVNLAGEQRLWRVPLIDHTALNVGEFLVGAFTPAAQIFDREDASVVVSNENQDDLIKNMVTILVEERLVQAIFRPESFVFGDYSSVSGG